MINLRTALQSGTTVIGTWCNSASPIIAELLGASGFDYVCVDAEHSAVDTSQCQALFQAISAGSSTCAPIVRVPGVNYAQIKRYLDAGARGIVCPLINSAEDAKILVSATKYPPEGRRGVGFCRANQFGVRVTEEFQSANNEILTVIQIEHIEGVKNLESILAVPGIDAVFIGPYDLSASMGITAQFDHPDFVAAKQRILDTCNSRGIMPGIHVVKPDSDELLRRAKEGYRFLAYSLDITMLLTTCQSGLNALKGFLAHRDLHNAAHRHPAAD